MLPALGRKSPEIARSVVLLPAPFAPSRPTASPSPTVISSSRIALTEPYAALTPERTSIGSGMRAGSEICANDILVRDDFLWKPFGDLLTVIENDDPVCDRHDCAHHVLDDHDRQAALRKLPDQRHRLIDLGVIEPRHHL